MEFLQIEETEFAQFSKEHKDANFWQSTSMAHLRAWNGWDYVYIGVKDKGELLAACMLSYRTVFLGMRFVQAVRGFYIDYHNVELMNFFDTHLKTYLKQLRCMYFKIDPYLAYKERDENGDVVEDGFDNSDVIELLKKMGYKHAGFVKGNDTSREPNWMFVSDIKNKTADQLLKEFDHQTRWSIQKTKKIGITISEVSAAQLPQFKKIMEHTAKRRGFVDHDMHYYEGLFKTFKEDGELKALFAELDVAQYRQNLEHERAGAIEELAQIMVILQEQRNSKKFNKKKNVVEEQIALVDKKLTEIEDVFKNKKRVTLAASTFMTFGREIVYLYSGAYEEYMKFNGPYALQWHMFQYALEHKKDRYNFYGISGIFEKDAEDYGIYEFKKGFHGTVVELVGDFYLYMRPFSYRIYTTLRTIKHLLKK